MKIRFNTNVNVDLYKTKLDEIWPKYITRWNEFEINSTEENYGNYLNIHLVDGDILLNVPKSSFEIIKKL